MLRVEFHTPKRTRGTVRTARHAARMADERTDRWRGWIDGPIRKNVLTMHLQRDAYMKVTRILSANKNLPDSYWWEFMVDTYITTQAIAVRRQTDLDGRVASLARLISQIRDKPDAITREYWIGQWRDDPSDADWIQREAERGWATQYGGDEGDHLDPSIPVTDLEALRGGIAQGQAVRGQCTSRTPRTRSTSPTLSSPPTLTRPPPPRPR